jgi:hypothetical protein
MEAQANFGLTDEMDMACIPMSRCAIVFPDKYPITYGILINEMPEVRTGKKYQSEH